LRFAEMAIYYGLYAIADDFRVINH
jgi:hypothetical protein